MSSIRDKLVGLQSYLDGVIDNAPCFIASDRIHAWEILKNKPGTAKIAIGFETAKARSTFPGGDITGRDDQTIYAIISRGRGLNQKRSDNLIYGSGGGRPLFDLAEELRTRMRMVRFDPHTDEVPNYMGMEIWGEEFRWDIDAYICRIWVGSQLPQPIELNPVGVDGIPSNWNANLPFTVINGQLIPTPDQSTLKILDGGTGQYVYVRVIDGQIQVTDQ